MYTYSHNITTTMQWNEMHHLSLCVDSVISNSESMQTIKDKRKYKLQQLFKVLSLSLDIYLKMFSPLVSALSMMVSWKSAHTITTHGFSSGHVLVSCICAPAWYCCCHWIRAIGTQSMSNFLNAVNSQLNANAFCEKNYS